MEYFIRNAVHIPPHKQYEARSFECIMLLMTIFVFIFSDTVFTMNCDINIKQEEDPLSCSDIKSESQVSYKFFNLCFVLSLHNTGD